MLANSAETLPRGHFLIEPYLFDVHSRHADGFGSLTYMLYGVADRLTVGLVPVLGYNVPDRGARSSGVALGDVSVQAQYRLTQFHEGSWFPTLALMVKQTLPTGKYDRLGDRPSDGLGGGVHTTTVGINAQSYFWLPNGRILRARFDVQQGWSGGTRVDDVSVYGTIDGFRGRARPGSAFFADVSLEYSVTRSWVVALDATCSHDRNTRVTGYDTHDPADAHVTSVFRADSGSAQAFALAPALEYSWTPNIGVLLGARVIFGNRHTPSSITPAIAINYVH